MTNRISALQQPNYSVPALDKGLDVLEALAACPRALILSDLSRELKRSSSALFRTVDALEKRGYVTRDPLSGAYRLTLKLYELAHTHSPVDDLLRAAVLPMRRLSESVRETCSLSVLNRGKLVIIAEELSPERVRLSVEIGSQVAPLQTVSGRLLIAFLERYQQQLLLEADPDFNKVSQSKRRGLLRDLQAMKQAGFTVAPSEFRVGLDLAALVGNPASGVTASVAIPCLAGGRNEGKEMEVLAALVDCAKAITGKLGLSPASTVAEAPVFDLSRAARSQRSRETLV